MNYEEIRFELVKNFNVPNEIFDFDLDDEKLLNQDDAHFKFYEPHDLQNHHFDSYYYLERDDQSEKWEAISLKIRVIDEFLDKFNNVLKDKDIQELDKGHAQTVSDDRNNFITLVLHQDKSYWLDIAKEK